jgi:hypothetical protein
MANDVKNVLVAANTALTAERDEYSEFYNEINNAIDRREAKMILDRRNFRLQRVQQVQNFRRSLVLDLNEQSQRILRLKL